MDTPLSTDISSLSLLSRCRALYEVADCTPVAQLAGLVEEAEALIAECRVAGGNEELAIALTGAAVAQRYLGNLGAAQRLALDAVDVATEHPRLRSRAQLHLTTMHTFAGDFAEALETADAAERELDAALLPRLFHNKAFVLQRLERYEEAFDVFAESLTVADELDDEEAIAAVLNNRGALYSDTGRWADAEVDLRRALLLRRHDNAHFRASAQHNLGLVLTRQGMLRAGLEQMERARPTLDHADATNTEAALDRAEALFAARSLRSAQQVVEHVTVVASEEGSTPLVPQGLMLAARIAIAQDHRDEALTALRRAKPVFEDQSREESIELIATLERILDLDDALPASLDSTDVIVAEALLLRANHLAPAGALDALAAVARITDASPLGKVLCSFAAARTAALSDGLEVTIHCLDECFDAVSEMVSTIDSADLRSRAVSAVVPVEGLAAETALHAGRSDLLRQWVVAAAGLVHRPSTSVGLNPELRAELERLGRQRSVEASPEQRLDVASEYEWQRRQLDERIRWLSWSLPASLGPDQQGSDDVGRDTLIYGAAGDVVCGIRLSDDQLVPLGRADELSRLLGRVRFSAKLVSRDSHAPGRRELQTLRNALASFEAMFVTPLLRGWAGPLLRVQSFGPMRDAPWPLLETLRGQPVTVVTGRHQANAARRDRVALVVGPGLLPDDEIAAIARLYDRPMIVSGERATVERVSKVMETSDVVHIAAHGALDASDPLFAGVRLADGRWTGYDAQCLNAVPDTVVLASCRIGGSATSEPTGHGLASSLVSKGCRQVIASSLPISDRYSQRVMPDLHEQLVAGVDAGRAIAELEYGDAFASVAARSLVAFT